MMERDEKPRVLLLVPAGFDSLEPGKHIPSLAELVSRLARATDLTVAALTQDENLPSTGTVAGARVHFARIGPRTGPLARAWRLWRLAAHLWRQRPFDVVHGIWGVPGGLAAVATQKRWRVPAVVSLVGFETASLPGLDYGGMLRQPVRGLLRWTCRWAAQVCCLTAFQRDQLAAHGVDTTRVAVIPYGAEGTRFIPGNPPPPPPYRFLHVANHNLIKDQATLLRAFAAIAERHPAHLRFVGPDHLDGAMPRLTASLGLTDKVSFTGFVPHGELPRHFQWAHALLHTSLHEAQAVVVAEAAAAGLLLFGTRTGLLADLAGGAAAVVAPGDHEGLAQLVLGTLDDPVKQTAMRGAAGYWARTHEPDWTAARYLRMYTRLANRGRRPGGQRSGRDGVTAPE